MFDSVINYLAPSSKAETIKMEAKPSDPAVMSPAASSKTWELEQQHRMAGAWFQPSLQPSSQLAWDATRSCYQELPVLQIPPGFHPPYSCPVPEGMEEGVALAPTALPLVDLFGGFMELVDNLYTSSLVQYVCAKTRPSDHRLAAEVLARSNLNPNAKEFTPVVRKVEEETKEEEKGEDEECIHNLEEVCDKEAGEEQNELEDSQEDEEEEKIHTGNQVEDEVPLVVAFNSSECDTPREEGKDNEEEDEVTEEDEESDDWWDSDEDVCSQDQQIDPAEFEDLFPCGLMVTSLTCRPRQASPDLPDTPIVSFTSIATISLTPAKANTKMDNINRIFNETYSSDSAPKSASRVCFSEEDTWEVIEEPEELAEELAEARVGEWEQRRADRERMERTLGPVLMPLHRQRIYAKIYGHNL